LIGNICVTAPACQLKTADFHFKNIKTGCSFDAITVLRIFFFRIQCAGGYGVGRGRSSAGADAIEILRASSNGLKNAHFWREARMVNTACVISLALPPIIWLDGRGDLLLVCIAGSAGLGPHLQARWRGLFVRAGWRRWASGWRSRVTDHIRAHARLLLLPTREAWGLL